MPQYKESTTQATEYTKPRSITIQMPVAGVGRIQFEEELVIEINGKTIRQPLSTLVEELTDPTETFVMYNPVTGNVVNGSPTVNYLTLYRALYSLYRHIADKRDNPPA